MRNIGRSTFPLCFLCVSTASMSTCTSSRRYIDVACNLLDPMFMGVYNDKPRHESDLHEILNRAQNTGVKKIMITGMQCNSNCFISLYDLPSHIYCIATGTTTDESSKASEMASTLVTPVELFFTAGVHPTQCRGAVLYAPTHPVHLYIYLYLYLYTHIYMCDQDRLIYFPI